MSRKPKTKPTPEQRLRAKARELKSELEAAWDLNDEREREISRLCAELELERTPIKNINTVDFHPRPQPNDAVDDELIALRRLISILDDVDMPTRHRLLAMVDARYFDPPAKAAV